jgi:hypothetical protein
MNGKEEYLQIPIPEDLQQIYQQSPAALGAPPYPPGCGGWPPWWPAPPSWRA